MSPRLPCPFSMARIASTSTIVQEALELPSIVDCPLCHVPVFLLPRGPHLWSPLSHLPFQELPTINLFLADLIFLPTLTIIVYFFCFPILCHPFSPSPSPLPIFHLCSHNLPSSYSFSLVILNSFYPYPLTQHFNPSRRRYQRAKG